MEENVVRAETEGTTDGKAQRLIAAALGSGSDIERGHRLYLAIQAFTAEDFRRLLLDPGALKAMAEKLGSANWAVIDELADGLIGRWLEVDPDTVMTWAPRLLDLVPAKERARSSILEALAKRRPEAVLAMVSSRKDAKERADLISSALEELTIQSPARARAWLDACTDPADRLVAEKAVRAGAAQTDPLRAIELAGAAKDRTEASALLRSAALEAAKIGPGTLARLATAPMPPWMLAAILSELNDRDPVAAVDLALKAGPGEPVMNAALQGAFSALAQRDREEAMAKVEGLSGAQLGAAVSAIAYHWALSEPVAALEWLAARPLSERMDPQRMNSGGRDALLIAFSDWATREPEVARQWADGLAAGEMRDRLRMQLARDLAKRGNAAEATQVFASLGAAADLKALSDVAQSWAQRDPLAAADWAIAQPAGPLQGQALAGVVGAWANENPGGVQAWLAQFPAGEIRDRSVAAFLLRNSGWASSDAQVLAEFDTWFGSMEDPWQRARVAQRVYWVKREADPAAARAWLSSLPKVDPELIRVTLRPRF